MIFTTTDIFDNIIQTIQRIPSETYYFKRQKMRVDDLIKTYMIKLDKMITKLPKVNSKKLKKFKSKLERLFKVRKELLNDFQECLKKHIEDYNKLCEIADRKILPKQLKNIGESRLVIRIKEKQEVSSDTFCTCNDIAYGQMICCDNIHCDISWYHFKCVGLHSIPNEGWICHNCKKNY
ncbi:ING4 [Hepatospora eriocheir]|uniref:ING4 n=2 Tax=Hepatospora eriocheir TaxID=1081669 RepID=A0A1X0QHS6_9MICR|nr:ING4 [Hepatospora eriocheir]